MGSLTASRRQLYCCQPSSTSKTCFLILCLFRSSALRWKSREEPQSSLGVFVVSCFRFAYAFMSSVLDCGHGRKQLQPQLPLENIPFWLFVWIHESSSGPVFLLLCLKVFYHVASVFIIHWTGALFYSVLFYLWKSHSMAAAMKWISSSSRPCWTFTQAKHAGDCVFYMQSSRNHYDIWL